jgi:PilZ domain
MVSGAAANALASLPGRKGVAATSQEGTQLTCDPFQLDGEVLRVYLPRLQMGGVDELTLRFAVGVQPWRARFRLTEAEYHTFDQAIGVLQLVEIEEDGAGRQAARFAVRAPGLLTAIFCQNAVDGNEYEVRVDDISETGIQLSTELHVERNDEFAVALNLEGRRVRVEAKAANVVQSAYGRFTVGARITKIAETDVLAIRRLAAQGGA